MAWFLAPYKRQPAGIYPLPVRYCAMRDFDTQIKADGGKWAEVEILSPNMGRAVVKVVGVSASTLATINAAPGFVRIPLDLMNDSLGSLTNAQRTAIRNEVLACGYTTAEVNAAFPNLATKTVGDVLRFLATRRLKPRFDSPTNSIICDGSIQSCASIDALDTALA